MMLPELEIWTEIRCPACVPLGWQSSRLLLKAYGPMKPSGVFIQIRCHRCKSLVQWEYGMPLLRVVQSGPINHKRQRAVFE